MNSLVNGALNRRLARLGCERLPQFVVGALRANIDLALHAAINRIVEREVTSTRIGKIFAVGVERKARSSGGFEGDATGGPFDQSALLILAPERDETKAVTGTAALTTILPP
jgi:hypothetical protein